MKMKLYHLRQDEVGGYDTYSDMVVAATSAHKAKRTSPSPYYVWKDNMWCFSYDDGRYTPEQRDDWANNLSSIKVKYLGIASNKIKAGVICSSFHAG